jgi:hypothetical protein
MSWSQMQEFPQAIPKRRALAESAAVKVERSPESFREARGRVVSNTLTAPPRGIQSPLPNCFLNVE